MIDLGLSKLMLIGVVALVVIGPERLPKVARMAGALFGRAQRYVNDVKAEVGREMELDELRNVRREFEDAARNVESTVKTHLQAQETSLNDIWKDESTMSSTDVSSAYGAGDIAGPMVTPTIGAQSAKRRNWRVKRGAMPVWYKQANSTRTRVQSGAARMARHTPQAMRRPMKFF